MSETDIDDLEAALSDTAAKSKRLTPAEWEQVKTLWEFGNHTLAQLAAQFGIRADTIQRRLKDDGVEKGARAHEAAQPGLSEVEDRLAKEAAENVRRINETKNDHYRFAEALAKMTMQEIINARTSKHEIGTKNGNITTLGKAAKTLEILRKERYSILGLDREDGDPDEMDELLISELSEDQIRQMQAEMRSVEYVDPLEGLDDLSGSPIVIEGED